MASLVTRKPLPEPLHGESPRPGVEPNHGTGQESMTSGLPFIPIGDVRVLLPALRSPRLHSVENVGSRVIPVGNAATF